MSIRTSTWTAFSLAAAAILLAACGSDTRQDKTEETTTTGAITISVDESLRPVMEQQVKVFDSSFPGAELTINYKPETQCFKDLQTDRARLIVTTRDLTAEEQAYFAQQGITIRALDVARSGIALVTHPKAADSILTIGQLKEILKGTFARRYTLVFDNKQSGTVRYMLDSLIPGHELSKQSFDAQNNDSVIAYVSRNEQALGFVGVPHIYDPQDESGIGSFKKNIRVIQLKNDSTGDFYQPYQAYLANQEYPLTQTIYFILKQQGQGLGTGFANFLSQERGQLIFFKFRLAPTRVPLVLREAEIK